MIASPQRIQLTPEQYLAWEAEQPYKHEYLNGEAYAMTGGTLAHNAIGLNLAAALKAALRGRDCRVFISDVKVQVERSRAYFYPDVVVTCHPQDLQSNDLIRHPCLILEVLSPSTEGYDRGEKFRHYRQIGSLQEYGLISAERMGLDLYRLNSQGKWELTAYFPEADYPEADCPGAASPEPQIGALTVTFASLGIDCTFDTIYEDVPFL